MRYLLRQLNNPIRHCCSHSHYWILHIVSQSLRPPFYYHLLKLLPIIPELFLILSMTHYSHNYSSIMYACLYRDYSGWVHISINRGIYLTVDNYSLIALKYGMSLSRLTPPILFCEFRRLLGLASLALGVIICSCCCVSYVYNIPSFCF